MKKKYKVPQEVIYHSIPIKGWADKFKQEFEDMKYNMPGRYKEYINEKNGDFEMICDSNEIKFKVWATDKKVVVHIRKNDEIMDLTILPYRIMKRFRIRNNREEMVDEENIEEIQKGTFKKFFERFF